MGKLITSIVTLTVAIILTYASTASAGGFTSSPEKTDRAYIKDHYVTKIIKTPNAPTQTCREVDVPIYGNTGGNTDGAEILGAIIGGVIGSKIGSGDGSKVATGVGAVIGSKIGKNNAEAKNNNIVGYKRQTICETHTSYSTVEQNVYSHSTIRFTDKNGKVFELRFQRNPG
tara:strand:- start:298 stop:813 length:516 start_codon:yes stop_codon:yes gene_type:complete